MPDIDLVDGLIVIGLGLLGGGLWLGLGLWVALTVIGLVLLALGLAVAIHLQRRQD